MASKKKKIILTRDELLQDISERKINHYQINTDYKKDCTDCDPNDYHRNCRLIDIKIEPLNVEGIMKDLLAGVNDPLICSAVERIYHIASFYDTDRYTAETRQGYYGEEIEGVTFDNEDKVREMILSLQGLDDRQIVLKLMEYEYGFILPVLSACQKFIIQDVPLANVAFPNDRYVTKVSIEQDFYQDWPYPLGVCLPDSGRYRVVDGYHRLASAMMKSQKTKNTSTMVQIIVGY